ncbi:MAG: hypothetical protein ABI566_04730 [Pseudolysinimonas sp.]
MTDTTPQLQILGDAEAASCDGDVCELPEHREAAIMNRRLDADLV